LKWIGVDIRRLGIEDFVRLSVLEIVGWLTHKFTESCKFGGSKEYIPKYPAKPRREVEEARIDLTSSSIGLATTAFAHRDILHQILGVVVLTGITSTLAIHITSRACYPSTEHAPSASSRDCV
jgi:hypothetical protein